MQLATAKVGPDPGQHQPGLPHLRARVRAQQGGLQGAGHDDAASRPATTSACCASWRRSWRRLPGALQRSALPHSTAWIDDAGDARLPGMQRFSALLASGDRRRPARRRRSAADAAGRRPDQHPVHQRHHRLPQGRDADAPQHPQQRLLHRRVHEAHAGRPALHPGAALPLLRHGAGQPRLPHARRDHRLSRTTASTRSRCWRPCRPRSCTGLHGVPTMFIAELDHPRFERVRPVAPCAPASWPARRARSR